MVFHLQSEIYRFWVSLNETVPLYLTCPLSSSHLPKTCFSSRSLISVLSAQQLTRLHFLPPKWKARFGTFGTELRPPWISQFLLSCVLNSTYFLSSLISMPIEQNSVLPLYSYKLRGAQFDSLCLKLSGLPGFSQSSPVPAKNGQNMRASRSEVDVRLCEKYYPTCRRSCRKSGRVLQSDKSSRWITVTRNMRLP